MAGTELPEAGARLVLDGLNEFISGLTNSLSGLNKLSEGLTHLGSASSTSAAVVEQSTNRVISVYSRLDTIQKQVRESAQATANAVAQAAQEQAASADKLIQKYEQELRLLNSLGTTGLDRKIMTAPEGPGKEDLQLERVRQNHERYAQQVHSDTLKIIEDANAKASAEEKALQRITTALNNESNARVQNLNKQMEAQRAEAQTFEANMRREMAAADADIVKQNELLIARERANQLAADIAPIQSRIAALNEEAAASQRSAETTSGGSLQFVRSITAIVAANNLLNVGSLNTVANIGMLAASFDRAGGAGIAFGAGLGVVLAGINALVTGYNNIVAVASAVLSAIGAITAALVEQATRGFANALDKAAEYQRSLAFFTALTNATSDTLTAINSKIEGVATTTLFGMNKAAEAVNELGRAGASTFAILQGGALEATIALATAANGELSLADAAKATTGTVGAFTRELGDGRTETISYTDAVNALTGAAQLSRLSFMEVVQGFRQAAPLANSAHISIADLAATIAILGNASETGTLAGTSFKQMILDLENPSKKARDALNEFGVSLFTSQGALRPWRDIVIEMNNAFGEQAVITGKVTEQQQKQALAAIFGSRAALAANIITNQGVEALDRMRDAMQNVTAVDMANIMVLPLTSRLTILQNILDTLGTTFAGPFVSAISDATNAGIAFFMQNQQIIDIVRLAGQAIVAVATNEGFGAIQDALAELTDARSFQFFVELLNFARNVRSAFVDTLVPAVGEFITILAGSANAGVNVNELAVTFDYLSAAVRTVVAIGAELLVMLARWIVDIKNNEQAMNAVINVLEGLATVIGVGLVASFFAVAVPMGIVLELLRMIGVSVDPLIRGMLNYADAIVTTGGAYRGLAEDVSAATEEVASTDFSAIAEQMGDVVLSIEDGAGRIVEAIVIIPSVFEGMADGVAVPIMAVNDATGTIAETCIEVATGVNLALQTISESFVATASDSIDANIAMAEGVIEATNEMVDGQAEGMDNWINVTKSGVDGVGVTLGQLDDIYTGVADAPNQVVPLWQQGWNALVSLATQAMNAIGQAVGNFFSMLGSALNAAGQAFDNIPVLPTMAFSPAGIPVIAGSLAARATINAVRGTVEAANSVRTAVGRISENVPQVTRDFESLGGRLRGILDNISANADATRQRIADIAHPRETSTDRGEYPGGGGGGGGGGGRGRTPREDTSFNRALQNAQELGEDLSRTIQNAGQRALEALQDIAVKQAEQTIIALREYNEKVEQIINNSKEQITQLYTNRDQSRSDRARREAFNEEITREKQRRSEEREDRDEDTRQQQESEDRKEKDLRGIRERAYDRDRQDRSRARDRTRQDEDIAHQRQLDDEERHLRKLEELHNKKGPNANIGQATSRSVNTEETTERQRIARQRAREDMERARGRTRQDEDVAYERNEDDEARRMRDGEDEQERLRNNQRRLDARAQKRADAKDDFLFDQGIKERQRKFDDTLEDEALARRRQKIEDDKTERLRILDRELAEKIEKINSNAEKEAAAVIGHLNQQLEAVRQKLEDKLPEIAALGGEAIQPVLDAMVANLEEQMGLVATAAHDARMELGLALGLDENAQGEGVIPSIIDGMAMAGEKLIVVIHGIAVELQNVVDKLGPPTTTNPPPSVNLPPVPIVTIPDVTDDSSNGSPQFGVAPVNNDISDIGAHGGTHPAPQPLTTASTVAPSVKPAVNITNSTVYNVDANYSNNQSPASIGLDLSALSQLSRK